MECPICYESLDSGAYSTICGHVFGECILKAIESFGRCPICSKTMTVNQIHKVYLPNDKTDDGLNHSMVESLVSDFEGEKKKRQAMYSVMQKLVDNLGLSLSKIDTENMNIVKNNENLAKEVAGLKKEIGELTDKMNEYENTSLTAVKKSQLEENKTGDKITIFVKENVSSTSDSCDHDQNFDGLLINIVRKENN